METDVGQMLEQSANRFGDRTATLFVTPDETRTRSFEELDTHANQVGNGLLASHIGKGDAVGLLARNCPEFVSLFFGAQKIGARITPINVRFGETDVNYVVRDADLDCLVVQRDLLDVVADPPLDEENIFVIGGHDEYTSFEQLKEASETNPGERVGPDAIDGYYYTSGSTGDPKGVLHTHSDRIFTNLNVAAEFGLRRSDVNVTPLPLFHSGPLYTGLVPFIQYGVPTVYFPEFDPELVLETVADRDGTILGGVPAQYDQLTSVDGVEEYDLDSLRFWWVSGAPLTEDLRERCRNTLSDRHSIVYGATEAGPPISILPPEESAGSPGSCGTGLMAHEVRIVDPDGDSDPDATVPPGKTGELVVRGESVMHGYLNRPEETERAFVDDWFFTGDLARQDGDGYIYIQGRKDDMIISGGENVYPAEIEDVLRRHDAIDDVAVVPVSHDKWGQTPKAFVVPENGSSLTPEDVEAFCKQSSLADYKRPREIAVVAEIPRNPSGGSVLKDELESLAD